MNIATNSRKKQWSWALYDWANSAFATAVLAGFFPVFFKQYWAGDIEATDSTFWLGVASALASGLVLILAPLCGALSDTGRKKSFLAAFTLLGVLATGALFWVPQNELFVSLMLFVMASIGFFGGLTLYDSLMSDIAVRAEYDRVSALGYGMGYLGGGLLFAINVGMTLKPEFFGLADAAEAVRWSFLSVALWWALFALPLFINVQERKPEKQLPIAAATAAALRQLSSTIRSILGLKQIALFLAAYWLYIDGVHTIIRMAVDYGLSLGLSSSDLLAALLLTQFVAFPAAIAFGWLGGKIGARGGIFVALTVYIGLTAYAWFLDSAVEFYAMATVIGLVQGGIQSLSRSYYASMIPDGQEGEFFGFYNMMGKFAAIIGPLLVGITAALTDDPRLSLMSVLILFLLGGFLLMKVHDQEE